MERIEASGSLERMPVFVYGTLRRGQKNYPRCLQGRTLEEIPATVRGELHYAADGGYPYLLPGAGTVAGELMVLDPSRYEETVRALDLLEEYDAKDEEHSVYLRRETAVALGDGRQVAAWTYYWNCPGVVGEKIKSGDFTRRSEG